jgi:hypothetical protein
MNNENKIVVTSWTGKSWEMTPEQIEAAYRYRELQYRIDNAKNQLEFNADWIKEKYGHSIDEVIGYVEEFLQDNIECNVSEDNSWINYFMEMFNGKKDNND